MTGATRTIAVAAAAAAAALYLLIGLGVLWIGESTTGGATDLLGFGMSMAALFGAVSIVVWRATSRRLLVAIAVLQVVVIVGYVAFGGLRSPAFEPWGLLIKGAQAVLLGVIVWSLADDASSLSRAGYR
jgi:hypothetical protein